MSSTVYEYCMNYDVQWIVDQWDTEQNEKTPHDYTYGSKKHVWWKCAAGHSWTGEIGAKLRYRYHCPYCSGQRIISGVNDFATVFPSCMQEFMYEKNATTQHPSTVKTRDTTQVWWQCQYGHEWKASYASRANGRGCRICAGKDIMQGVNDLLTVKPETASCYSKKNNIPLSEVFAHDTRLLWWNCVVCQTTFHSTAHRWTTVVCCDTCSPQRSAGEVEVLQYVRYIVEDIFKDLKNANTVNMQQGTVESNKRLTVDGRIYEVDIFINDVNIAIEYNGDYWHSDAVLLQNTGETAAVRHARKMEALETVDITLVYVWEHDWKQNTETVKQALYNMLKHNTHHDILHKLHSPLDRPELFGIIPGDEL